MGQSFSDNIAGNAAPISGLDPFFVKGVSPSMRAVEVVIQELAQSEVSVLLLGETGAGKERSPVEFTTSLSTVNSHLPLPTAPSCRWTNSRPANLVYSARAPSF